MGSEWIGDVRYTCFDFTKYYCRFFEKRASEGARIRRSSHYMRNPSRRVIFANIELNSDRSFSVLRWAFRIIFGDWESSNCLLSIVSLLRANGSLSRKQHPIESGRILFQEKVPRIQSFQVEIDEIFNTRYLKSQVLTKLKKRHIKQKKRKPEFWGASGLGM